MTSAQSGTRACPACNAAVGPNARICPKCRLEVSKMAAFAAAKRAAASRGIKRATIETNKVPFYRHFFQPIVALPVIALVVAVTIVLYFLFRPSPPPPWSLFPPTPTDAARTLLTDISADNNKANEHAYSLIPPSARDSSDTDEEGHYYQIFTTMDHYLATEFGAEWITILKLEPDKADATDIIAHIGLETLHIRTALQTPPDKANGSNDHYAVLGIDEFNIADAAGLQQAGVATGLLRGYGATGSITQLETIKAALGGHARETPMQTKLRILPNLRNPRAATRMVVLQAWPVRHDAVVRNHLQQISTDGRYDAETQQTARDVLAENVPLEDLIAGHVNTNN